MTLILGLFDILAHGLLSVNGFAVAKSNAECWGTKKQQERVLWGIG